jgi:hypothetical protein
VGALAPVREAQLSFSGQWKVEGHMDSGKSKADWSWLPQAMPRTAKLIAEKRRELGNAHVNECWKRGVLGREPGWFFAREGGLAVGMPWDDWATVWADVALKDQVLLVLRTPAPGAAHGA